MKAVRNTLYEALLLTALALAVGFSANAVRGSGHIKPLKNYFDTGADAVAQQVQIAPQADASSPDGSSPPVSSSAPDTEASQETAAPDQHPQHPYQEVSFQDVVNMLNDPNTELGLNVFVDARGDAAYEDGHIPGAIQCDPYNVEPYIDTVLAHAMGAEKVVVYCGGGDCEDSIFMCRELIMAGLPYEAVSIYPGGWKEWLAKDMPRERGGP